MHRKLLLAMLLSSISSGGGAAEPKRLTAATFKPESGTVFFNVNWGRVWKCSRFENAQLELLTFSRFPLGTKSNGTLSLEPASKIAVTNKWILYAYSVDPGQYALTGFDVKVAQSVRDVRHLRLKTKDLVRDGEPIGGTFTVAPREIAYLGNFWLDCSTADAVPWRYFSTREEFPNDVAAFRNRYPFTKSKPIQYRLFETSLIGQMIGVEEYTVQ